MPDLVAADAIDFEIYLVDGQGGIHADSGDPLTAVKIGVGDPGAQPTSGTFTLTHSGNTTTALAYNATPAALQAALEALVSIGAGNVSVSGEAGAYTVEFVGARALQNVADITLATNNLFPDSTVSIWTLFEGSGSQNEKVSIRILRYPMAFSTADAPAGDHWNHRLNLDTLWVHQALAGDREISTVFEVELTYGDGDTRTILQAPVTLRNETLNADVLVEPPDLPNLLTEEESLAAFVNNRFDITGLTGGGATNLDGQLTADVPVGRAVRFKVSTSEYFYRLEAGTDAESSPLVIRPDDYAASTNEKVWRMYGAAVAKLVSWGDVVPSGAVNLGTSALPWNDAHLKAASLNSGAAASGPVKFLESGTQRWGIESGQTGIESAAAGDLNFRRYDSGGTGQEIVVRFLANGNVRVGNVLTVAPAGTSFGYSPNGVGTKKTVVPTGNTGAVVTEQTYSPSASYAGTAIGTVSDVASGGSQNFTSSDQRALCGFATLTAHAGTGAASNVTGGFFASRVSSGGGNATAVRGVSVVCQNLAAAATVTDAYGVYIDGFTATGAITNRWGIYQVGGSERNYFAGPVNLPPRAAPGSPSGGDHWNDSTQQSDAAYIAGATQYASTVLFSATATASVHTTTSELTLLGTGIGTKTLPASILVSGKTVRVRVRGWHTQDASAPQYTIRAKLGATTIASAVFTPAAATSQSFAIEFEITCRTAGSSGTVFGQGTVKLVEGSGTVKEYSLATTAATTINTTTSQAIDITAQPNADDGTNSRLEATNATIEVLA